MQQSEFGAVNVAKVLEKIAESSEETLLHPNVGTPNNIVERLVKSTGRVRDLGEVFTPAATVRAMLDLIPNEMWQPHPSATFLEPACGDGNFLIGVLERKLANTARAHDANELPAGKTKNALHFHILQALASIYAVDISADNVVGGTPGHEIGARDRLLIYLKEWYEATLKTRLSKRSVILRSARWIVERNIQIGNMLATNSDGTPSKRNTLPLVEYNWSLPNRHVTVVQTTLGAVMAASTEEVTGVTPLFTMLEPNLAWEGKVTNLYRAPIPVPIPPIGLARNGKERRT